MPHIIIDGYNYINRVRSSGIHDSPYLDVPRRSLLNKLAAYKKIKGAKITVVFDAYRSFWHERQRENYKGIDVVYTKEGETADDLIIGWIREGREGIIVVSSDREIIDEAKSHGVAFLTPVRMEEMITGSILYSHTSKEDDEDEDIRSSKRKGNPKKLPKRLRKATKDIKKI